MRRKNRRGIALLLVCALALAPAAIASDALGSDIQIVDTKLSHGTSLAKGVFWSATYSDLRQEHYISYQPNSTVKPIVSYGNKVTSKSTLTASAQKIENTGSQVVAGINGDYYVVSTGVPLGIVVTDGALRSSSSYLYGIGIRDDGTAFIGQPNLTITGKYGDTTFDLAGFNKVRSSEGGIYLFTEDFGTTTMNTQPGVDVILTLPEGGVDEIKIGGTFTATVEQVIEANGSATLETGKIILSANQAASNEQLSVLRNLKPGDTVELSISSADTRWNDAEYAMGGLYRLLEGGEVVSNLPGGSAPRTAVGTKADGTIIFYTIDGRQPGYSIGATMTQIAMRMKELGCTEAICLDGGGSTSLGVTMPDEDSLDLVNSPSDGAERANSTCFLLVSDTEPSGLLGHFYVKPYDAMLLCGANLRINTVALDTNYHVMDYEGELSYAVYDGDGVISPDGLFTAGTVEGPVRVGVSAGNATGEATVTVVKNPTAISVKNSSGSEVKSLTVSPNSLVDLTASATYQTLPLTSQNTCFTWTIEGNVGTVSANGRFTAGSQAGTGTLIVSAGSTQVTIPITVVGHILPVEDFESSLEGFSGSDTVALSSEGNSDYVKYGWQSMQVDYRAGINDTATFTSSLNISGGDTYVTMWVYGDSSGNVLRAVADGDSGSQTVNVCTLDFSGWKQVSVQLPERTTVLKEFIIDCSGTSNKSGTIWLDHMVSANEPTTDLTPPTIQASISGTNLTATIKDDSGSIQEDQISLAYDGGELSFTFDESTGALSATLPVSDGKLHQVTLVAGDVSGNLGRYSKEIAPVLVTNYSFIDIEGNWAAEYAQYLYDSEVVDGIITDAGRTFQPNRSISRSEFAVMLSRWMGISSEDYRDVTLPFTDAASIPDWALGYVKAMYALGIIRGGTDSSGALVFSPSGDISRAEVATILYRTLQKGFAREEMTFSDAASVPDWAKPAMETLTTMGVLSGYQNQVRPTASITRGEVAKLLVTIL